MPDPANLTPGAVETGYDQLVAGEVIESAHAPGDKVRCVSVDDPHNALDDPLGWHPVVLPAGLFYPKKGDAAIVAFPVGSTAVPRIIDFEPSATVPDHAF